MLRLPPFRLAEPATFEEAALLAAAPGARLLAGGTDLLPRLKRGQARPELLVDLGRLPGFRTIARADGGVCLGAGARIAELARHPLLTRYAALRQAAASVATPQIRNQASLGGNLAADTRCVYYDRSALWREGLGQCLRTAEEAPCRAAPGSARCLAAVPGDLATALLALGARVRVQGLGGARELPLAELYADEAGAARGRPLSLKPGEILAAVLLGPPPGRSGYLKLRRRESFDFAALGVAAALALEGGKARRVALALGGAGIPVLAADAAAALEGEEPTPERVARAAEAARAAFRPVENADYGAAYRRKLAGVYAARLLRSLL